VGSSADMLEVLDVSVFPLLRRSSQDILGSIGNRRGRNKFEQQGEGPG